MKNFPIALVLVIVLSAIPAILSSQHINLISYNIRYDNKGDTINNWNDRKATMAALIQHYDADIVGTQEGLHHQITYLDSALPGFSYLAAGRDDGKEKWEYTDRKSVV